MKKSLFFSMLCLAAVAMADDPCAPACPPKPFPALENCRCDNVFTYGEFLYWRYSSPNFGYGRSGVGVVHNPATQIAITRPGTTLLPDYQYNPGFRVGLGVKFGEKKAFDVVGIYTYMHNNPRATASADDLTNGFLPINWYNSSTAANNTYNYAHINMNLNFNYAEVQSGYSFGINPHFALRPYFALASYIFRGDVRVQYNITTAGDVPQIARTHGTCHSWSIGPKVGVDFVTHITQNWGIYTNFNITQQISHINMKAVQTEELPLSGTTTTIQNGNLIENRNIGLFGLEIGPTWDQWFYGHKYHLYLRATYGASTLSAGANMSFLNNNNQDIGANGEFRGLNVRALFEF